MNSRRIGRAPAATGAISGASGAKTIMRARSFATFLLLAAAFIGWSFFVARVSPQELVEALGIENGYAAVFLLAFAGGLSTFIVIPYYLGVATFAAGGLNPFLLGLTAGAGVLLGDSTSYLLGYHGHGVLPDVMKRFLRRFWQWRFSHSPWIMPIILFLYAALVPFPNDLFVIPLGLLRYPAWKVLIPLGAGNAVFNTIVAFAGTYWLQSGS